MNRLLISALIFLCTAILGAPPARAESPAGLAVYMERCVWCHGAEGYGDGPGALNLAVPPRDFTEAVFKYKSTPEEEMAPTTEDLFSVIAGGERHAGLSSIGMPGWDDTLSDAEIRELIEYIRSLSGIGEPELAPVSLTAKITPSPESIKKGKKLFEEKDRCTECHGALGRGDGKKRLKDDWGHRTWPRNLTRAWSFRGGAGAEDIYTRITVGIAGTQMPSFANERSKKRLTEEERWHVANYVASLNEPGKKPVPNTTIRAGFIETAPPTDHADPRWAEAEQTILPLVAQFDPGDRLYNPTVESISVKALFGSETLALRLEWDDPTESIPGEKRSKKIATGSVEPDSVAVQFPSKASARLPYFNKGDALNGVEIWKWRSRDGLEGKEEISITEAHGPGNTKILDTSGFKAHGKYTDGRWSIVITGGLKRELGEGGFIPIAISVWDGSNEERGNKHTLTTWHWIATKKDGGAGRFLWALAIAALVAIVEIVWLKSSAKEG